MSFMAISALAYVMFSMIGHFLKELFSSNVCCLILGYSMGKKFILLF